MIIAPILIDIKRQNQEQINIFSGIDFTVEPETGLSGSCDFLITKSAEMLIITAPIIVIVEAKKENLNLGSALSSKRLEGDLNPSRGVNDSYAPANGHSPLKAVNAVPLQEASCLRSIPVQKW
ncbi:MULTISPECIES: hypothetical protein [unclassified Okeania]|uniref:hypothetical protein n=1 Tax=unclassified Okeania TaxID=2634635 RepID=UPI0013BC7840|nr:MULTISPECIES: hypothetical protein [unclassified Okeania]NES74965.1 hypothetical protein [Okeania sp. SIO1H4]NET18244.1 hypothetical protein [Okeania sp. SIO1H5]NET92045.1 hypothetical protein [Okeania sp. SIO1H2]